MTTENNQNTTSAAIPALNYKLMRALMRLRDYHADMTLLQALAFLLIASKKGVRQDELYRQLDMADSAASRTIALFSDVGARGFPGLDLIRVEIDSNDRRYRIIHLTQKGQRLAADLADILSNYDIKGKASDD